MHIWIAGVLPIIVAATLFAAARGALSPMDVREAAMVPALQASPVACRGLPYTVTLVVLDDGVPLDDHVDLFMAIDNRVGRMYLDDAIIDTIWGPIMQADGTVRVDLRLFADSQPTVGRLLTRQAVLRIFDASDLEDADLKPTPGAMVPPNLPVTPIVANADLDGAYATWPGDAPVLRLVLNDGGVNDLATAVAQAEDEKLNIAVAIDRKVIDSAFSQTPVPDPVPSDIDLLGLTPAAIDELVIELRAGPLPEPLAATFEPHEPEPGCL